MTKLFQSIKIKPIEGTQANILLCAMMQPKKKRFTLIQAKIALLLLIAVLSVTLMIAFNGGILG